MMIIPNETLQEWESKYYSESIYKQITLHAFIAHCAALWGYDKGLTAFGNLCNIDPEYF
jgi:hypothetical protein